MDINVELIIFWSIVIVAAAYVIVSTVLFIKDSVKVKKQHVKRSIPILVMFIIAMVVVDASLVLAGLIGFLAYAVMKGM